MAPPTVRQVYALAAALCERSGEEFPATREVASHAITVEVARELR